MSQPGSPAPILAAAQAEPLQELTAIRGIGYLLPDSSWRTWTITPDNAAELARQLTSLVQRDAEPYLRRLSSDPAELLAAAQHSPGSIGVTGHAASPSCSPGTKAATRQPRSSTS